MTPAIGIRGAGFLASPSTESPDRINTLTQELWGRQFRRMSRFTKLALSAAAFAARDSGVEKFPTDRTGVFLGTGLGNLSDLVPFSEAASGTGDPVPSPTQFVSSVGNAGAYYVSQALGLRGPALVISQGEASFEAALLCAGAFLEAGDVDFALVGGVDVFHPPETRHVLRMGYEANAQSSIRFGDGAGWLVMERLCDADFASVESVSQNISKDVERDLKEHVSRDRASPNASLALGSRLRRRAEAWLPTWTTPVRLFASEAPPSTFLAESAVWTCQFLASTGAPGELFHCAAVTPEDRLGLLTVRRIRDRRPKEAATPPGTNGKPGEHTV